MCVCVTTQLEKLQDQVAAVTELKAAAEAKNAALLEREAGLKESLDAEVTNFGPCPTRRRRPLH